MRLVVTHLTRMKPGFVCLAGIDPSSGMHVRPVLGGGSRLRRDDIAVGGRELQIGTEVDLGPTTPVPDPPEVEDHVFAPGSMRRLRELTPTELQTLLKASSQPSLTSIFGTNLQADGRTASVPLGSSGPSLGCLHPATPPRLEVVFDSVKLLLVDGGRDLTVAVTDLRLFEPDQTTIIRREVARLSASMVSGEVYLCVGLSRPYSKPHESRERHWLQINNVIVL